MLYWYCMEKPAVDHFRHFYGVVGWYRNRFAECDYRVSFYFNTSIAFQDQINRPVPKVSWLKQDKKMISLVHFMNWRNSIYFLPWSFLIFLRPLEIAFSSQVEKQARRRGGGVRGVRTNPPWGPRFFFFAVADLTERRLLDCQDWACASLFKIKYLLFSLLCFGRHRGQNAAA